MLCIEYRKFYWITTFRPSSLCTIMSSEKSVAATQEPLPNPSVQQNTNESIQSTGEQEPPSFKFYRPPGSNLTTLSTSPSSVLSYRDVDQCITGELPDSYFTPSAADLRVLQASLMARSQALSNAPLRTQSMRETEEKSKLARYPTVRPSLPFSSSFYLHPFPDYYPDQVQRPFSTRKEVFIYG